MKTNYKGKGEHSVIQLEKIIEERETEISELKRVKYKMIEMLQRIVSEEESDKSSWATLLQVKTLIKEATEPT